ncbi:MAG: hypothetical protein CBD58_02300 [bacterium TMED198]|nr:MAG: hypothetical protein CBD58_02300 [bacterium TMED198]
MLRVILATFFLFSCNKQSSVSTLDDEVYYFNTPHGVVVDDLNHIIYLSDRGNGYLHSYTCVGDLLSSVHLDEANNFVSGVNISSSSIYACNQQSSSVSILDATSFTLKENIEVTSDVSNCYFDAKNEADCLLYEDEGCYWMVDHCMPPSSSEGLDQCSQYNFGDCQVNSDQGCMWMGDICMMHSSEAPHYIVLDEEAGYWFVTSIMTGYVLQYSIDNNELVGRIKVGDQPALMAINKSQNLLYVSRMMQMTMPNMDMGSTSNDIHSIEYSEDGLSLVEKYSILAPNPHGIDFDGKYIYTISNSSDQIVKIDSETGMTTYTPLRLEDGITGGQEDPSIETFVLKPIACKYIDGNILAVTCQGGSYTSGNLNSYAPSQVQLWNTDSMTLIDRYEFSSSSSAWHVDALEEQNKLFVALSGSGGQGGGIVCLIYSNEGFAEDPLWQKISSDPY